MSVLRSGLRVIAVVGFVWLAIIGLAWAFQERMIYLPNRSSPPSPDAGSTVEEVVLDTVDFLRARDDVDAERIVYLGESLGSAVVAAVAVEQPPAALVLRSPFPSLVEVARQHYPFLPVRTLLRERHPTVEHLERYAGPTLVVAGERDRIIPPRLSREVADSAGASYLEIPETGHNDRALLDGDIFLDGVDAFVRDAVSG